jgi:hypothetical protein
VRLTTAAAIAALLLTHAAPAQKPKASPAMAAGATVQGEIGRKLDERMGRIDKAEGGFCGNVMVSVGGKVLLEKGYGVADATERRPMPVDALWDWASVSKQFTAAAILKRQDRKKLKLDDTIRKFYPDVRPEQGSVTLRQPGLKDYALGWMIRKDKNGAAAFHSGGVLGVVAYVVRGIDDDDCVATATSAEPRTSPDQLAAELLEIARGG